MQNPSAIIKKKTEDSKTSTITLEVELPALTLDTYRAEALRKVKKDIAIDGFRKGHVPDDMVIRHVGEGALLQEAADLAVSEELPILLATEKVPAIATPRVTVTKLAPGNPLCFTAIIEILPSITLPDYKAIAKKIVAAQEKVTVQEKEVDDVLLHLRRERARIAHIEDGKDPEEAQKLAQDAKTDDLPAVDDEFVKGLRYESAQAFTEKLRENITQDKTARAKDKLRTEILEQIADSVKVAIPETMVHQEVHKMEAQFRDDLAQAGLTFEEYLKRTGKDSKTIHQEWHDPAAKRAKMQLIISEIAVKESIQAAVEKVDAHVAHTQSQHKDIPEPRIREYFTHILRNEAVLEFLESVK